MSSFVLPLNDEVELAWAAGFFDGEGNTRSSVRGPRWATFIVQIKNTDPTPLHRFQKAVGLGAVYGPYSSARPGWSQFWHYQATGWDGERVIELLRPYLCESKAAQADAAIEIRKAHRSGYRVAASL